MYLLLLRRSMKVLKQKGGRDGEGREGREGQEGGREGRRGSMVTWNKSEPLFQVTVLPVRMTHLFSTFLLLAVS